MRIGRIRMLVGGCAYSLVVASTTPFTLPADIMTAVAIIAMTVMIIARWPLRARLELGVPASPPAAQTSHRYLPWIASLVVCVAWELFNFLAHGSRASHPTVSSIADAVDRIYLLKSLMFLGWLSLGWIIVRRGSRHPESRP